MYYTHEFKNIFFTARFSYHHPIENRELKEEEAQKDMKAENVNCLREKGVAGEKVHLYVSLFMM